MSEPRYLTAHDLAARWELSKATVLDWFEDGRLPGIKLGGTKYGRVRFRESDVEAVEATWKAGATVSTVSRLQVIESGGAHERG